MQQTGGSERTQQKQPITAQQAADQGRGRGAPQKTRERTGPAPCRWSLQTKPTRTPEAPTPPAALSQRARHSAIHTAALVRGRRLTQARAQGDPARSRHTMDTHTEGVFCVIPIVWSRKTSQINLQEGAFWGTRNTLDHAPCSDLKSHTLIQECP